jgi:hypothetical protein
MLVSAWHATWVIEMRRLASYCCALLLLASAAHAAEPGASADDSEAGASTNDSTNDSADDSAAPADIDSAIDEEIRAAEAASATPQRGTTDESFVPSVQISEDLSVSFPVDI